MSSTETWTIKRLLEWTTDYLQQNGSDSSRLDAEVLLAETLDCQRIELYTAYDQIPAEEQLGVFRGWIRKRAEGVPVAYLVGHREFYSLSFQVNENVLIPRPETELLVTQAIDFLSGRDSDSSMVCDVGTGSGCIAVAIVKNNELARVTGAEISPEAIEVAQRNIELHNVGDRVEVVESDLLSGVDSPEQFDLIVSNPPYIGLSEKSDLARDVVDHEPHLALFSGQDGTDAITALVEQASNRLKPGGKLMIEISPVIAQAAKGIAEGHNRFGNVELINDLSKHPRVLSATLDPS